MAQAQHDLGLASRLHAEALGKPGERRFRIQAEGPGGSAVVWLEKEELRRLALAVAHLLELLSEAPPGRETQSSPAAGPALSGDPLEFQAASWTLGYDEGHDALEFLAYDQEQGSGQPALRFWATRDQGRALSEEALKVYAAGRPVCALCGAPLDTGVTHVCPRANGHVREE